MLKIKIKKKYSVTQGKLQRVNVKSQNGLQIYVISVVAYQWEQDSGLYRIYLWKSLEAHLEMGLLLMTDSKNEQFCYYKK